MSSTTIWPANSARRNRRSDFARFKAPMMKKHPQIPGAEGIASFFKRTTIRRISDASATRYQTIVSGGTSCTATPTKKKALLP